MSEHDRIDDSAEERPNRLPSGHDGIEALLRAAGQRPAVPVDRWKRVEAAVRTHWRSEVRARSRRRRIQAVVGLGLAAAVVAAVILGIRQPDDPAPLAVTMGRVDRVVATAWSRPAFSGSTEEASPLRSGDEILAGSELATDAKALLAVRMQTGHSLRLDAGTRLTLVSSGVIAFDHGGVYVDSGGAHRPGTASLEIRTPFGSIRDVGTQFEVRLHPESLRVRVREGSILVEREGSRVEVGPGQELELAAGGRESRRPLTAFGSEWTWIGEITPMMRLDGRPLAEFLDWMARERGLRLQFASPRVALSARDIKLSGSIDGMTLDQALESVLSTTRMTHRITESVLFIDPMEASPGPS